MDKFNSKNCTFYFFFFFDKNVSEWEIILILTTYSI